MSSLSHEVPVESLSCHQLKDLLESKGVNWRGRRNSEELRRLAKEHAVSGLLLTGSEAIEYRAKEMVSIISRLDRTLRFEPGTEVGVVLRQVNHWAIVLRSPTDSQVGQPCRLATRRRFASATCCRP